MLHMRMDRSVIEQGRWLRLSFVCARLWCLMQVSSSFRSDVQDVFMNHVIDDQRQSKATGKKSVATTASMPSPQQQQQHPLATANTDLHHQGGDLQTLLLRLAQGATTDSGAGNAVARSAIPFPQSVVPFAPGTVAAASGLAMNLTQLPAHVPDNHGSAQTIQDQLLQQILNASELYLTLPLSPSAVGDSATDPVHTVLKLLQIHGKELQDCRAKQRLQHQRHQQQTLAATTSTQAFVMGLLMNARQHEQHPQGNGVARGILSPQVPQLRMPNALLQLPAVGAPTVGFTSQTTSQNQGDNSITSIAPSGPALTDNASIQLLRMLLGTDGGIQLPLGATGALQTGSVPPRGGALKPT
jgi:hypothetical protein